MSTNSHSRRLFLIGSLACAAIPRVAFAAGKGAGVDPEAALRRLVLGNKRYVEQMTGSRVNTIEERAQLGNGQAPWASILTCADSRTAPEILFNQGLGDIFVARVAGNIPEPAETASLEYASAVLGSRLIVVMGHSGCGAVKAAIEYSKGEPMPSDDLTKLVRAIQPAVKRAKGMRGDLLVNAIKANALIGAEKLRGNALLTEVRDKSKLEIVAAYCDLATGKIAWL
jgi:carbonic anhydrase